MAGKKILLVDDELDLQKVISIRLESMGFVVSLANDGEEALSKVQTDQPDLILLDVMMPGIDGFETCKKIRENGFTNKIVIYTAKADAVNATKARVAGADDFTVKTTRMSEIADSIKNLLS